MTLLRAAVGSIATVGALVFAGSGLAQDTGFSRPVLPEERARIESVIRDYLLRNPEILVEALQALQAREAQAQADQAAATLAASRDALIADPDSPVGGNPKGTVTVVEFFDYNCPYCKRASETVQSLLGRNADIRYVYKEWPILDPKTSVDAAKAGLAVYRLGGSKPYEAFHHALLGHKGTLSPDVVDGAARKAGIDPKRLRQEMAHPDIEQEIAETSALAQRLGISGTPTFVIGDEILPGAQPLEALEAAVKQVSTR